MFAQSKQQSEGLSDQFARLVKRLQTAVRMVQQQKRRPAQLDEVASLLAALPLATDEYGTARMRLRNAENYLQSNEPGAARWELENLRRAMAATAERLTETSAQRSSQPAVDKSQPA